MIGQRHDESRPITESTTDVNILLNPELRKRVYQIIIDLDDLQSFIGCL